MEKFQEARARAKRNIQIADHMLTQTYPFVKDPKLLLAVMENIFLALTNAMASVLYYERLFKRIPPFQDTFESKFNMFKLKTSVRYNIDNSYLMLMQEVRDMVLEHKKSPVEFSRHDSFVICSENYHMKTISTKNIQEYITKTKLFIEEVDKIVSKDENLFTRNSVK